MKVVPFKLPVSCDKTVIVQNEKSPYFYPYLHMHEEIQLTYIKRGEGTLLVGNSMHSFKSNEIYLIGANQSHVFKSDPSYFIQGEKKSVHAFTIFFSTKGKLASTFNLPELRNIYSFYANHLTGFKIPEKSFTDIAEKILNVDSSSGLEQLVHFFQLLKSLTDLENLNTLSTESQINEVKDYEGKRLTAVYDYVRQNYHEEIRLEKAAATTFMTPEAFCRYFKKHTGSTFSSYLNNVRINEARKKLLERTNDSVSSIAYECGFKSITNFNKVFKTNTGKSPRAYLNEFMTM